MSLGGGEVLKLVDDYMPIPCYWPVASCHRTFNVARRVTYEPGSMFGEPAPHGLSEGRVRRQTSLVFAQRAHRIAVPGVCGSEFGVLSEDVIDHCFDFVREEESCIGPHDLGTQRVHGLDHRHWQAVWSKLSANLVR